MTLRNAVSLIADDVFIVREFSEKTALNAKINIPLAVDHRRISCRLKREQT
jgi:hypothetical protein